MLNGQGHRVTRVDAKAQTAYLDDGTKIGFDTSNI
jgi:hypothetical protein